MKNEKSITGTGERDYSLFIINYSLNKTFVLTPLLLNYLTT